MFTESRHKTEYGESPQVLSTVPGVTVLAGEFSVLCNGHALCAANERTLFVEVSRRSDSTVHVFNSATNDRKKFGLSSIKYRKEDRWGNYVKGMLLWLQGYIDVPGMNITLSGDLLCCDGRIQSAAIGVGVGLAAYRLVGLETDAGVIASCCWSSCSKFCSEMYNLHFILSMLHAQKDRFMLFDMQTASFLFVEDPFGPRLSLVMANGNIPPAAMREELYSKHAQGKCAMDVLSGMGCNVDFKVFPFDDLKDRQIPVDEGTRTICCYIYDESRIALGLAQAFTQKDFSQIGKCLSKLGAGLRDGMELTCPELEWLSKRSTETSCCLGGTVVNAGGGGCIAMVMDDCSLEAFSSKLDEYERIFGFKATASAFSPAAGASASCL